MCWAVFRESCQRFWSFTNFVFMHRYILHKYMVLTCIWSLIGIRGMCRIRGRLSECGRFTPWPPSIYLQSAPAALRQDEPPPNSSRRLRRWTPFPWKSTSGCCLGFWLWDGSIRQTQEERLKLITHPGSLYIDTCVPSDFICLARFFINPVLTVIFKIQTFELESLRILLKRIHRLSIDRFNIEISLGFRVFHHRHENMIAFCSIDENLAPPLWRLSTLYSHAKGH